MRTKESGKHHSMSANLYYFHLIEFVTYSGKEWIFSHNTTEFLNSRYSAVSRFWHLGYLIMPPSVIV